VGLEKLTKSKIHAGIRLDFYLPDHNVGIEVHGIQHYKVQSFGADSVSAKMNYNRQLFRDDKLRSICDRFEVKLIEIPYDMSFLDILNTISEGIE
jgi:hypothetical protein